MVEYRKANGVTDANLRTFMVTEVYLRRVSENLRKKKYLECTQNLDLETLIAKDSWATLEEMENIVSFHINKFKRIIEKCKQPSLPSKSELVFCTRFVATKIKHFKRLKSRVLQ